MAIMGGAELHHAVHHVRVLGLAQPNLGLDWDEAVQRFRIFDREQF